ncbi:MAG: 3-phosphoshikimate 1-carboxyvinyltransferase [Pseudohongiellaceae bacterium]|jgi:3-phosphoshikimate 1-carboxyvinyltransferase
MGRVLQPLRSLGAEAVGERLPFTLHGAPLRGGEVTVDVPSAQVKSALLLAGLRCDRALTVVQHTPTRDHTEGMLPLFGAHVDAEPGAVTVYPGALHGAEIDVFGDPSSAAFLVVAALLVPGSQLVLNNVGLWPRRTGFLRALAEAGAEIEVLSRRTSCGDLLVCSRPLQAFEITPNDVPDLVDEVPVLALAAALAQGTGLAELRLKESDRVAATAKMLQSLGVEVALTEDELTIVGTDDLRGHADCDHDDHRLAMTAAIARLVSGEALPKDVPAAAISWPGFLDDLRSVTAQA